ncbi:hypothetical protein MmTuc01_1192 [Methanosarcina mazei Tuc01]|uniref:Uncharacterized protein n=1 Tax=Methanosarcina mazei Tuc01 TaxID=1236903 RepID=M1QHZ4_METMZ|nr:hypothetical protein MmTuc01_1192 [Methanosarcina mazei Tuc01]
MICSCYGVDTNYKNSITREKLNKKIEFLSMEHYHFSDNDLRTG